MIKSKRDYIYYVEQDCLALRRKTRSNYFAFIKNLFSPDSILIFQKLMRKLEYYHNRSEKNFFHLVISLILRYRYNRLSVKLGFSIPINVFGPGLSIVHYGTIVISENSRIGANCRINVCTNIGASGGNPAAPIIGDNVYIAPGAVIYGNIKIGNNIAIAANAAVNKSFVEENILIGGVPAKLIQSIDIKTIIKHI